MTGTAVYQAGLLDLRAGTIQPLAYVRGLGHAAIAAGAQVFTKSPVVRIGREAGAWQLSTPDGSVSAKRVLLSTDIYTSHIAPELRHEQIMLPMFHVATTPLSENARRTYPPPAGKELGTHIPYYACSAPTTLVA